MRASYGIYYLPDELNKLFVKLANKPNIEKVCLLEAYSDVLHQDILNQMKPKDILIYAKVMQSHIEIDNADRDFLTEPFLNKQKRLELFDLIFSIIPFGFANTLNFKFEEDLYKRFWRGNPNKDKMDFVYASHIVETLKNDGKAVVLCPVSILSRMGKDAKIRKQLVLENVLEAVIMLPEKYLFSMSFASVILVFNKNKADTDTLFIDASKEFERIKGKNNLSPQDIDKIYNCYKNAEIISGYSKKVSLQEITDNDFSLGVQLYVKEDETVNTVDLDSLEVEISAIEDKLTNIKQELKTSLKALGGDSVKK